MTQSNGQVNGRVNGRSNGLSKPEVYVGSGGKAVVFSAGTVTEMQKADTYAKVGGFHGCSGGALVGAYHLARQSAFGSRILWEDLVHDGFVNPRGMFSASAMRMEVLRRAITEGKPLDVQAVRDQPLPFWVKVYDTKQKKVVYVDGKENIVDALIASSTTLPYAGDVRQPFVDADMVDPIGIADLRRKHPESKLIVLLNQHPERGLSFALKNVLNGAIGSFTHRHLPMLSLYMGKTRNHYDDVAAALRDDNVVLVHPPKNNPTTASTRDPRKLRLTWKMGRRAADQVLETLENP